MLVALHLVFGQSHDCGIRSIGWFLELNELDAFIASCFGSQQKVASKVEPVSNFLILDAYELSEATSLALNRQEQKAKEGYEAMLSQGSHDRIAKAERVLPLMIATIVFFWCTIKLFVERLGCSEEVTRIWRDEFVASYYIASCPAATESG